MLQQLIPEVPGNRKLLAGGALLLILLVLAFAWWLWGNPAPPKPETYKPAAKQADGSVVLERKPYPQAKAKQELPLGAKLKRLVSITVQPRATIQKEAASEGVDANPVVVHDVLRGGDGDSHSGTAGGVAGGAQDGRPPLAVAPAEPVRCPPVTVDLALADLPAGGWRVIASSPDGEVVGGVDIPVEPAEPPPKPRLWAAGLVADPFRRTVGAFVDRDIGFARLGLQVNQRDQGDLPNQAWIKAGIRW